MDRLVVRIVSRLALRPLPLGIGFGVAMAGGCSSAARVDLAPTAPGAASSSAAGSGHDPTAPVSGDRPSDVYPAPHPPLPLLKSFGGPVLAAPTLVTITYAGDERRDALRKFGDTLFQTSWWQVVTRGYGVHAGSVGAHVELPDTVSGKTLDNDKDIKPLVQSLVASHALPVPDASTLYAFYFPAQTTITLDGDTSCDAFGAYHDAASVTVAGKTIEVAYAVMPRCGASNGTVSSSHEIIEAATDAHPVDAPAFYLLDDAWAGGGGAEAADLCEGRDPVVENGFSYTRSWVNLAASEGHDPCQPADPGEIFFGAAVPTTVQKSHDPQIGDYDSGGYLVVARGASIAVDVAVFSEAPLPQDLALVVGKRGRSADPSVVAPIATGVDATLLRTTARNGQTSRLTIRAAAGASTGDHPFVVRAILSAADYHSWPVVLRVQ